MTQQRVQKAVSLVVIQKTPTIDSHKVNAYAVEQTDDVALSKKIVAYAVEQEISGTLPPANVDKIVSYGVEQPVPEAWTHKTVGYAVEAFDTSGNLLQTDPTKRPVWREGPLPYVQFGTGDELFIRILFPGPHTLVYYRPDDTFEIRFVNFVLGENPLPAVNFNQLVAMRGRADVRTLQRVRLSMRMRANP